jgi:hypothetical protein
MAEHEAFRKECLACGRRVIWAVYRISGKRIAVDPGQDGKLGTVVLIDSGRRPPRPPLLYAEDLDPVQHGSAFRYVPHAQTCRGKAGRVWKHLKEAGERLKSRGG